MNSAHPCQQNSEHGSVLIYALTVITFLSGLAAYLAAFSDSVIYRNQDAKHIVQAEYMTESVANIVEAMCKKDISKDTELNAASCSKVDNDVTCSMSTSAIKEKIAGFINKYQYVYLYNKKTVLVGTAHLQTEVSPNGITIGVDDEGTYFSSNPTYEISYSLNEKTTQTVKLVINKE